MSEKPTYNQLEQQVRQLEEKINQSAQNFNRLTEELIKAEERFRMIVENTSDAIWILDISTMKLNYLESPKLRVESPANLITI